MGKNWRLKKTEEKLKANNAVYKKVIQFCKDGQRIFKSESAKLDEFVWDHILLFSGVQELQVCGEQLPKQELMW